MSLSILSTVIVYFYVPETTKLSLEEIGDLFGDEVIVHLTADGHGIVETGKVSDTNIPDAVHATEMGAVHHGDNEKTGVAHHEVASV